jgi:hypothetical protein
MRPFRSNPGWPFLLKGVIIMQDKIKAQLKAMGLDETLAEKIKAEKEEDILQSILKYQVDSESDRRVTEALKTREKKLREEFDIEIKTKLEDQEKTFKKPDPPKDKDVDILKSIQDTLKPFTDKIAKLEQADSKRTRDLSVKNLLKAAELPEDKWFSKVTADTDDDIKTQVEDIKGLVNEIRQQETDKLLKDGTFKRANDGKNTSSIVEQLIKDNSKGEPGTDKIGIVEANLNKGK